MVRLKVRVVDCVMFRVWRFQFHYGSIKRKENSGYNSIVVTFQFHYGSIKSNIFMPSLCSVKVISIPLWFD